LVVDQTLLELDIIQQKKLFIFFLLSFSYQQNLLKKMQQLTHQYDRLIETHAFSHKIATK